MSQENVDLVRRAYERLAEQDALGDWSWFFEEFADEDLALHPQGTPRTAIAVLAAGPGSGGSSQRCGSGGDSSPVSSSSWTPVTGSLSLPERSAWVREAALRSRKTRRTSGPSATAGCTSPPRTWIAGRPSKPPGCRSSASRPIPRFRLDTRLAERPRTTGVARAAGTERIAPMIPQHERAGLRGMKQAALPGPILAPDQFQREVPRCRTDSNTRFTVRSSRKR
jgi:hypothetical protein